MDQLAKSSPPGANGVLFLPYLRPGGAPYYNPHSKGAFLGLSFPTKKEDLLRATMEAVAYNISLMLGFLEENNPLEIFASLAVVLKADFGYRFSRMSFKKTLFH